MTKETIQFHLTSHPWAEQITVLDTVNSTNTYLKELAKQDAPHGSIVIADHQTAGRGRLGRRFESPRGQGLYLSVLLRQAPTMQLTPLAAEAVRRALLQETGIQAQIKWINDLVCGGKKLCGILTEITDGCVIIGIGINCRGIAHECATSLAELGHPVDRSRLAAAVIDRLSEMSAHWMADYKANCLTLGRDVQLIQNGHIRYAHVDDMDDEGALLVTLSDGSRERIFSGEVSVRGMYGYV